MVSRLVDQTGADAPTIAAAYAATRDSFDLVAMNNAIDALDAAIPGALQLRLYGATQDLLMGRIVWFIRNVDWTRTPLDEVVGLYRGGIARVEEHLGEALSDRARDHLRHRVAELTKQGVPEALAERIARLSDLAAAPDIVRVSQDTGRPVEDVARTHFAIEEMFKLDPLAEAAREVPVADYFDRLALDRAIDGIAAAHRKLVAEAVAHGPPGPEGTAEWARLRGPEVDRIRAAVDTIVASGLTLSKLTVASSLLGDLARG